ncbi:Protein of unknown function, partial [Gryllus bimaculatus]
VDQGVRCSHRLCDLRETTLHASDHTSSLLKDQPMCRNIVWNTSRFQPPKWSSDLKTVVLVQPDQAIN